VSMWIAPGFPVWCRIAVGNSSRPRPIHRVRPLLRWGVGPRCQVAWDA
jgi:hypothetical protein